MPPPPPWPSAGLLLWCFCRRWCSRRPAGDLESGGHYAAQAGKPPHMQQQQQQFLVGGGSGPWQQLYSPATALPVPPPAYPTAPYGAAAAARPAPGAPFSQAWAFGYKPAKQRAVFTTDASKRSGTLLQRHEEIDYWLAEVAVAGRAWQGSLLYNDDPPQHFPAGCGEKGPPTGARQSVGAGG